MPIGTAGLLPARLDQGFFRHATLPAPCSGTGNMGHVLARVVRDRSRSATRQNVNSPSRCSHSAPERHLIPRNRHSTSRIPACQPLEPCRYQDRPPDSARWSPLSLRSGGGVEVSAAMQAANIAQSAPGVDRRVIVTRRRLPESKVQRLVHVDQSCQIEWLSRFKNWLFLVSARGPPLSRLTVGEHPSCRSDQGRFT